MRFNLLFPVGFEVAYATIAKVHIHPCGSVTCVTALAVVFFGRGVHRRFRQLEMRPETPDSHRRKLVGMRLRLSLIVCLCSGKLPGSCLAAALHLHSIKRAPTVYRCFFRCLGTLQTNTYAL